MSDTQAREEFEKWWYETKQIHLQPHDYEIPTVLAPWEVWLNCWNIAHEAGRKAGLEDAKGTCLQQEQKFLSRHYVAHQPFGSFSERFACRQCAEAIDKLITKPGENA